MRHHESALKGFVDRASADESVLAVIVSGSVARGEETAGSDIDLYLVVTDAVWDRALAEERIMYVEREGADYPDGYFDIKLATLSYLHEAVDHGDDPVRDSLVHSRVAFSRIPELERLLARAGERDEGEWDARCVSFFAQVRLHSGYFLRQGITRDDPLLLANAALHTVIAADRALLALNHRLFAGPKYLRSAVDALNVRPEGWTTLADGLLAEPGIETADALVAALDGIHDWGVDDARALSQFVLDNELAWRTHVPVPEYR